MLLSFCALVITCSYPFSSSCRFTFKLERVDVSGECGNRGMAALSTNKSGTSSFHAKAVASHCRNTKQNMFQLRIQQHPLTSCIPFSGRICYSQCSHPFNIIPRLWKGANEPCCPLIDAGIILAAVFGWLQGEGQSTLKRFTLDKHGLDHPIHRLVDAHRFHGLQMRNQVARQNRICPNQAIEQSLPFLRCD